MSFQTLKKLMMVNLEVLIELEQYGLYRAAYVKMYQTVAGQREEEKQ